MNKLLLHVGRFVFACLFGGCPPLCLSILASVLLSEQAASSRWQVCVCLSVGRLPPVVSVYIGKCSVE